MFPLWFACQHSTTSPGPTTTPDTGSPIAHETGSGTLTDTDTDIGDEPYRPTWIRAWGRAPELVLPSGDGRLLVVVEGSSLPDVVFGVGDPDEFTLPWDGSGLLTVVDPTTGLPVIERRMADQDWGLPVIGAADPGGAVIAFRGDDDMVPFPDDGGTMVPSWDATVVARVDATAELRWYALFLGGRLSSLVAAPDGSVYACGQAVNGEIHHGSLMSDAAATSASFVAAWTPSGDPRWLLVSDRDGWCTSLAADETHVWVGWSGVSRPDRSLMEAQREVLAYDAATGALVSVAPAFARALAVADGGVDVLTYESFALRLLHADLAGTVTPGFPAFAPYLSSERLVRRADGWMLWGVQTGGGSLGVVPSMEVYGGSSVDLVVGMLDADGRGVAALDAGTTSFDAMAGVVELDDGSIVAGASGQGYIGAQRQSPSALGHPGGGYGWLVRWDPVR
ncbi:MAG: hypothetical protein KC621_19315 [Myxococcales bacterium]|nr:hypothetical protein [Myxococcales bacterium]